MLLASYFASYCIDGSGTRPLTTVLHGPCQGLVQSVVGGKADSVSFVRSRFGPKGETREERIDVLGRL